MDDILTFSLHQKQRHYVRGTLCTTYVSSQCYAISRTITKITVWNRIGRDKQCNDDIFDI